MSNPFDRSRVTHYNGLTLRIQSYPKLRFFGGWQQTDKIILDDDVLGEIRSRSVGNKLEVTTHVNGHSVTGNNIEFLLKEARMV